MLTIQKGTLGFFLFGCLQLCHSVRGAMPAHAGVLIVAIVTHEGDAVSYERAVNALGVPG